MNSLIPGIAALQDLALALVQASVTSSALVVLLLLIRRWGKGAVPVRWVYGLALLAMARLALPVLPESAYGLRWQAEPAIPARPVRLADTSPDAIPPQPTPLQPVHRQDQSNGSLQHHPEASPLPSKPRPVPPEPAAAVSGRWVVPFFHPVEPPPGWPATPMVAAEAPGRSAILGFAAVMLLWIGGTLTVLLRAGWQTLRFQQRIRRHAHPADAGTTQLAREMAQRMGLRKPVRVLELPGLAGPVSCGWRTPLIFLPEGFRRRLTTPEVRHILAHESAHLRHWDSVLNCLLIPLCALHWFNPMVWLCRRILLADRELLRDQQAIRALRPTQEGDGYGRTLLKVTLLNQMSAPAPGLTSFFNTEAVAMAPAGQGRSR